VRQVVPAGLPRGDGGLDLMARARPAARARRPAPASDPSWLCRDGLDVP
jgi:hypothetical protein